jgi:hypothetical protein
MTLAHGKAGFAQHPISSQKWTHPDAGSRFAVILRAFSVGYIYYPRGCSARRKYWGGWEKQRARSGIAGSRGPKKVAHKRNERMLMRCGWSSA